MLNSVDLTNDFKGIKKRDAAHTQPPGYHASLFWGFSAKQTGRQLLDERGETIRKGGSQGEREGMRGLFT